MFNRLLQADRRDFDSLSEREVLALAIVLFVAVRDLLTKTTADFLADTGAYDLVTMDIVWAGAYAENGYSVDLTDWVARDAAELELDDIYPVLLESLGQYEGRYVAFPFASYANLMVYRKDLFEAAGLEPPQTTALFD